MFDSCWLFLVSEPSGKEMSIKMSTNHTKPRLIRPNLSTTSAATMHMFGEDAVTSKPNNIARKTRVLPKGKFSTPMSSFRSTRPPAKLDTKNKQIWCKIICSGNSIDGGLLCKCDSPPLFRSSNADSLNFDHTQLLGN